jgi:hypothetical protein
MLNSPETTWLTWTFGDIDGRVRNPHYFNAAPCITFSTFGWLSAVSISFSNAGEAKGKSYLGCIWGKSI